MKSRKCFTSVAALGAAVFALQPIDGSAEKAQSQLQAHSASECPHCRQSLSNAFVEVAKNSRPAVVHIRAEINHARNGSRGFEGFSDPSNPFEQFQEELFQRFFGFPPGAEGRQDQNVPIGTGSGVIVSSDGYIVTNHHVVKDATKIVVERYEDGGIEHEAQLIGCDTNTDIAILKIQAKDLPYLEFADSDAAQVAQWVIAIGHPFKLRDSVTTGVISALHRGNLQISKLEDFIQTDAVINPGNSGGPLMDLDGKIIGVNTAILSRSGGHMGVGFAVPSNIVKMVYEQVKQNGCVDRAFLGVQIQDLNEDLCEGFRLKRGTTGALIAEVVENSPANRAGLESGDVVIEFNGAPVKTAQQLHTSVGKLPAGTKCTMTILRSGRRAKINLTLGSKTPDVSQEGDAIHKLGLLVEQVTPENAHKFNMKSEDKGVVITKVNPHSIAAMAGWRVGTLIMVVNGKKIQTVADFKEALEATPKNDRLVLLLNYRGRASFCSIPHPLA